MHDLLYHFFIMCWKQGKTPLSWKHSTTVLFYKKNDPTLPSNYRPIALLNTVYKLWTRVICHMLMSFCEQYGLLSEPQEGFRQYKDCQRQLKYLKLNLEDAKLHKHDIIIALLDIKSAFDSVDHPRLFLILKALGIPADAIAVIQDLHTHAYTSILTNFGETQPIPLRRGTIQGDSLSPLLFILFLEPLVRWLQINDRGYRTRSTSRFAPLYANVLAAADDLALLSNNVQNMQVQLDKVQAFADWTGMQLAPAKCETSAALWGSQGRASALDKTSIEALLSQLRIAGSQLKCIPPTDPLRYLGALVTMSLDWKPHLQMLIDLIHEKGRAIAASPGTLEQKLDMERQCTVSTLTYHFAMAPFSLPQMQRLDRARARVLKSILRLANCTPNEVLFLPHSKLGCNFASLTPLYAQLCAESFAMCLNDQGRLGILARAVLGAQMKARKTASLHNPSPTWIKHNHHMLLRKAAIAARYGLHVRYNPDCLPASTMDMYQLTTACIAAKGISMPLETLQSKVLAPLWEGFGYACTPFLASNHDHFIPLETLLQLHPTEMQSYTIQQAYSYLLQICCHNCSDLMLFIQDGQLAPPPSSFALSLFNAREDLQAWVLPTPCPKTLPDHVEVAQIDAISIQSPSAGPQQLYHVSWAYTPRPPPATLARLIALDIIPSAFLLLFPKSRHETSLAAVLAAQIHYLPFLAW